MSIPEEIKKHPYWCVRKGKVPYNPRTGKMAKPNDCTTFTIYEEAAAVVEKYDGFGVSLRDGLSAVDIDHCLTDGVPSSMAREIIEYFDSYTEISPSGEGIRILFYSPKTVDYDTDKYYIKDSKKGLEFYLSGITNRYVTVTGNAWPEFGTIRKVSQEEITAFADKYMTKTGEKSTEQKKPAKCQASEVDILDKAMSAKNGTEFTALFNGEWQSRYQSQSEADLAFCNMLAFWCDRDMEMMDRLFRQSRLYRSDKWEREDYAKDTMQKAIDGCKETYSEWLYQNRNGEQWEQDKEPEEWSAPVPLDEEVLPLFPVECLPPVMGDYVKAVAEAVQVPVDMTAVAALVTCALCVQKKFLVKGKENWLEPLNLYALVVAPPAERKSAVMQAMTKFVHEYERDRNDFLKMDIERNRIKRNILSQAVKNLEGKAAKAAKDVTPEMVFAKQQELLGLEVINPLRFLADDCTPEVLVSLLAENDGRMAVVSAEGGIFEILNGRYSQSVNIDVFLKAHAGDSIRIDRKGRPSEYIPHPALCVLLTIQPVVLDGLMSNNDFRGRGLTARFLYSIPQSKVGSRSFDTPTIPHLYEVDFKAMIRSLLDIEQGSTPQLIKLSPEALDLSAEFAARLEPQLKGELETIGDWAGKLHGAILRIAGVLHCVENREESGNVPITAQTMQAAIEIGNYFLAHAQAAYSLMGADEQVQGAKYILRQLEKEKYAEITRTQLTRLCKNRFRKADDANPALELLEEYGYIRKVLREYKGTGRKPDPKYIINPQWGGKE